ncbi:MAG: hypothetical protein KF760_02915 [Candidatus Eremiobacteraeota bacterium]|nr:hypothetical protein [Candidatus Eremiobacteraeota bacterium]MCW5870242.1 hypothetical protein [Candidatus Eremiobacteraeota bacterium]
MSARIWFNTRVLCCEEDPVLAASLTAAKARVTFAPLIGAEEGAWKVRTGDWANPDYPFALVEGHEVVLLRWPAGPHPAERVRWWLSACLYLAESARRSRVRALGLQTCPQAEPLLLHSGRFLEEYFRQLPVPVFCTHDHLLAEVEAGLAGA